MRKIVHNYLTRFEYNSMTYHYFFMGGKNYAIIKDEVHPLYAYKPPYVPNLNLGPY